MGYVHVLCNLRLHFCRRTGTTLRLPCCTCFCNSSVEDACMAFLAARLWRSMLLPKPRSTGCRCKRIPKAAATVEEVGQVATVDLKEEERLVAQLVPLLVAAKLQWLILRPSRLLDMWPRRRKLPGNACSQRCCLPSYVNGPARPASYLQTWARVNGPARPASYLRTWARKDKESREHAAVEPVGHNCRHTARFIISLHTFTHSI